MKKLLSIPFSILAYLWFIVFVCLFHPIQWICLNLFGYQAHKKSVDYLNFFLARTVNFLFSYIEVKNLEVIPTGVPIIFSSNHQGTFDIIGFGWFFRKFHPKFVSKIELGKGFPSISYNLRNGGSVLIDRKDPRQALPQLKKMAEYIDNNCRSTIIFPEGTRTRNGKPNEFAANGLKILCKYAPNAYVVPVTINNSWKIFEYGHFPLGMGCKISFTVHKPLKVSEYEFNTLFDLTEQAIVSKII